MFSVALMLLLAAGSCVNSIDLIQPDSMVVQPGQSLTITCRPSGYSVTDDSYATGWIRHCEGKPMDWIFHMWGDGDFNQNDALKNKFSYSRDTSAGTVTLTGQNLQPEDTAVYYCVRGKKWIGYNAFDYWGKGTMVTVTSATSQRPNVFPLMQCDAATADTITVGCLATGFTPSSLTYAWSKSGVALTDFIQYPPVLKNNLYTGVSEIRVRRQDWDSKETLQCAVTHTAGNAKVDIPFPPPGGGLDQPPTLKVLASSDEENEASFSCFAKDFSPETFVFKWLKNDKDIANKKYEVTTPAQETKFDNGTVVYSAASLLVVPSSEWTSGTTFTCQFKGKGETVTNSSVTHDKPPCGECKTADVDITILGPRMEDIFKENTGQIVCQVNVNKPSVSRIWWENEFGKELVSSPQDAIKITTGVFNLSLEITYDEWSQGVKRYCFVEHTEWVEPTKRPFERNAGEQTLRPSVFMLPPVQNSRKEMVTLTCYVKDFFPQDVLVTWLVDDEEAGPDYHFHTTNPVGHHGSYSAYAQLSLSLDQWQNDDVVYSCVVHHESVANRTKAIVRSVGYKTFEKTNLVNLNMNVPESCKAQ